MKSHLFTFFLTLCTSQGQKHTLRSYSITKDDSKTIAELENIVNFKKMKQMHCPSTAENIGFLVLKHKQHHTKYHTKHQKHHVLDHWEWKCIQEVRENVEKESFEYLEKNMFPFDQPIKVSLGFPKTNSDSLVILNASTETDLAQRQLQQTEVLETSATTSLPDGLGFGIVQKSIELALNTKVDYYWTSSLPKTLFFEYVLPYANVDEARNNWRPVVKKALDPILQSLLDEKNKYSVQEVVEKINENLWSAFTYVHHEKPIHFVAGQTPLIYDPLSVILNGYASCTGLSILFVDALRTAGIAARISGTPAWNNKVENGNHSWVEFYSVEKQDWVFLEAKTKGIPYNPCSYWFCNKKHLDGETRVYSARFDREEAADASFPMQWDAGNLMVVGEDRSSIMTEICGKC